MIYEVYFTSRTKIYGCFLEEKKMETFEAQLQNATLLFTNYQHHFSSTLRRSLINRRIRRGGALR